jgi:hypothetical protein
VLFSLDWWHPALVIRPHWASHKSFAQYPSTSDYERCPDKFLGLPSNCLLCGTHSPGNQVRTM